MIAPSSTWFYYSIIMDIINVLTNTQIQNDSKIKFLWLHRLASFNIWCL